jgi:hypothetical protein
MSVSCETHSIVRTHSFRKEISYAAYKAFSGFYSDPRVGDGIAGPYVSASQNQNPATSHGAGEQTNHYDLDYGSHPYERARQGDDLRAHEHNRQPACSDRDTNEHYH